MFNAGDKLPDAFHYIAPLEAREFFLIPAVENTRGDELYEAVSEQKAKEYDTVIKVVEVIE